ncbi:MAG: glycosyltransferase family 2 protein [Elusimicrobiota bacterium]|jgi:alpha-1,3-rhamnosyltransferase|nr:glycosyltransferase family 2 protein [Elusimicrobiota bacterium]
MQEPLVSVIIPAYNHEKYVQESIHSIINQTYKNIELLVLDDGSKDNTWTKICQMKELCEKRFVRVDFDAWQNQGICLTLNKMIDKAKGKYIYLIASDDLAKPAAIQKQVDFLESNSEYGQVMGDNEIIDDNSCRVFWDKDRKNIADESKAVYKTFAQFLQKERPDVDFHCENFGSYESLIKGGNYIPNGNLFVRNIILDAGKYQKNAPLEDWYINLQMSQRCKIKFIDEILFSYRWHSVNTAKDIKKLSEISQQTFYYELFYAPKTQKAIDVINEFNLYKKKHFLFFTIERYRSQIERKKYLSVFNKKFLISKKNIVFKKYDFEK